MGKGDTTRGAMIDAAGDLLQRVGYRGASMSQMIKHSGAPRGSIYHHFPGGKDELVREALLSSGGAWREHVATLIADEPDLGEALKLTCRALADRLEASGFQDGCPIATVALEASSDVPVVRETCAAHFKENEALIAARGRAAGLDDEQAAALATLVLSTLEGALLLAKTYGDTAPLITAGETLARLLPRGEAND